MDDSLYFRAVISLVFVLGLIGLLSLIIRKLGLGSPLTHQKNNDSRLIIKEQRYIDNKRKLLLIQLDNKEHLLLLSPTGDIVIGSDMKHETET